MAKLYVLLLFLVPGGFLISCNRILKTEIPEEEMKQRVEFLIVNMDSTEISWFSEWNYSHQTGMFGDSYNESFSKFSADGIPIYECLFNTGQYNDTTFIKVIPGPHPGDEEQFAKDFPMNTRFDIKKTTFLVLKLLPDSTIIAEYDHVEPEPNVVAGIFKKGTLFKNKHPFVFFDNFLKNVKKYSIVKSHTNPNYGEFIDFDLGAGYKILYLPDTSKINPNYEFKQQTIERFLKGKQIGKGWSQVQ